MNDASLMCLLKQYVRTTFSYINNFSEYLIRETFSPLGCSFSLLWNYTAPASQPPTSTFFFLLFIPVRWWWTTNSRNISRRSLLSQNLIKYLIVSLLFSFFSLCWCCSNFLTPSLPLHAYIREWGMKIFHKKKFELKLESFAPAASAWGQVIFTIE